MTFQVFTQQADLALMLCKVNLVHYIISNLILVWNTPQLLKLTLMCLYAFVNLY